MLRSNEASVWWSNRSTVVTYEHASSASFSTYLQLLGGHVELRELGRYEAVLLETLAPDISVPTTPCGALPTPDTSVATATTTTTTGRRWTTGTSKV
jgi:hypothetical protein